MILVRVILIVLFLAGAAAQAQSSPRAYETIRRSTGSYLGERDPLGFGLRMHAVLQSPYALWAGSPELFFNWAKSNAAELASQRDPVIPCHGNPVPASLGSYVQEGAFGRLAVGLMNCDDAAAIPFQLELLQGVITLRLMAQEKKLQLSEEQIDQLLSALIERYGAAASSDRNATAHLVEDPWIARLLSSQSPYTDVLERYTSVGQFRRAVNQDAGEQRELLRPAADELSEPIATALASAVAGSRSLAQQCVYQNKEDFRAAIRDVARRLALRDPVNPGVKEYLVLLRRPLRDMDHDVILSFRQMIPPASERVGLSQRDDAPGAQRVARFAATAVNPAAFLMAPAAVGNASYIITLFDPWSASLARQPVENFDDLVHLARIWATVTGASHHQANHDQIISRGLSSDLAAKLKAISSSYLAQHAKFFEQLQSDPSARADADSAREALKEATSP
jgi:uncharacterized protein (DUF2252 family)